MVKHYIRADITTPRFAPRLNYPPGWYENAAMINVRAYDDVNHYCYAELSDDGLFDLLMASGRVEELSETEFEAEVARLRR